MSNSEAKILRDELAKMIAEIKKRDAMIEELARVLEEGKKTTAELIMDNDLLRRPPGNLRERPFPAVPWQRACATEEGAFCKRGQTVRTGQGKDGRSSRLQTRPYRHLPPPKIKGGGTPQAGQVRRVRGHQPLGCTHHCQADNRHTGDAKDHGRDPCVPPVCMF